MRSSWFSSSNCWCERASASCSAWAPASRASASACATSRASSLPASCVRSVSTCDCSAARSTRMRSRSAISAVMSAAGACGCSAAGGGTAPAAVLTRAAVARRTMKRRSAEMRRPKRGLVSSRPYWPGRGKREGSISNGFSRRPSSMRWPLPVSAACIGAGPSQLTVTGPLTIAPSAGARICGRSRRSSEECISRSAPTRCRAHQSDITPVARA